MKEGKRTRVHAILYQTFHRLARTERDIIKLMVNAVENIKPICEVEKVRIAGTIYDVPGIVAKDHQQTLAIRWILEAAFKRRISYMISLEKCSFAEILDAYRKRGLALLYMASRSKPQLPLTILRWQDQGPNHRIMAGFALDFLLFSKPIPFPGNSR
ncbi:hypothetical protein DITRI_Ditri09bG0038400 [Diplodiscus trichospermus]